jgi:hypothetical protein
MLARLFALLLGGIRAVPTRYRPERHYMRGAGPASAARLRDRSAAALRAP